MQCVCVCVCAHHVAVSDLLNVDHNLSKRAQKGRAGGRESFSDGFLCHQSSSHEIKSHSRCEEPFGCVRLRMICVWNGLFFVQ